MSVRRSGRPEDVELDGERLATYRPHVGLFTLSAAGAERLRAALEEPLGRVYVMNDVAPFIAEGGTAFAKHVVRVDPEVRAGDEVLLVDEDDNLLGTGKARLGGVEMLSFETGPAVDSREGVE